MNNERGVELRPLQTMTPTWVEDLFASFNSNNSISHTHTYTHDDASLFRVLRGTHAARRLDTDHRRHGAAHARPVACRT